MQRRIAVLVGGIDQSTPVEQYLGRAQRSGQCRPHQRGFAVQVERVRFGARFQQAAHDFSVALHCRRMQRRLAIGRSVARITTRRDERSKDFQLPVFGRDIECRFAINGACGPVDACLHELGYAVGVTPPDSAEKFFSRG